MTSLPQTALPIRPAHLLKACGHKLVLKDRTLLMAIVNLTPDSFSGDGRLSKANTPLNHIRLIKSLIEDGADIIDLGAESTRPGAKPVSVKEESDRLIPVLTKLAKEICVPISVDTSKTKIVQAALDAGASIINNIQGTNLDHSMLKMVCNYKAAIVLMHMRGDPRTMQKKASYKNLLNEIIQELRASVEKCLEMGIKKDRIIIDPGIGFAKDAKQNLEIIKNLSQLHKLGCPVLIGPSRKSFIGHITGKDVNNRLMGTAAAVSLGIANGAQIVRVHDVKEMKDVILVTDSIIN
jgi:dihydropteroate synthase